MSNVEKFITSSPGGQPVLPFRDRPIGAQAPFPVHGVTASTMLRFCPLQLASSDGVYRKRTLATFAQAAVASDISVRARSRSAAVNRVLTQ